MTNTIILTMVTFMVAQAIRAIRASLVKERMMVKEGGDPLPTSVWVFLGVEVLTAPIGVYLIGRFWQWALPLEVLPKAVQSPILILQVLTAYALAVMLGTVVSVIIAFCVKLYLVRSYERKLRKKNAEQQSEWFKQNISDE